VARRKKERKPEDTLGYYVSSFFTNWRASDASIPKKIGLAFKNRGISLVKGGCCGHPGEPGC
jgi:hypothetical protein